MKRTTTLGLLLIATAWLSTPALAQGASSASGTIVDSADNPLPGVVVIFSAQGNPSMTYTGKTNKKGKYWVPGLYTAKEGDRWNVEVEAEGYIPINVKIVSRNVNKVLVGDFEQKLNPGAKIGDIVIRPLGHATIDLTLDTEEAVMERLEQERLQAPAVAQGGEGSATEAPPEPKIDPWDEALARVQDGDLEGSLELFEEAIEEQPEEIERVEWYAKVLYQSGRYEEAEGAALQVIERAPERLDARKLLASVYMGSGELEQAKAALDAAMELAPDDIEVRQRAAVVAGQLGLDEEAIASYEAITGVDPENGDAWRALGELYAKLGKSRKSEAAFGRAGELGGEQAHRTLYNQGVMIMQQSDVTEADTERAVDAFRKAVEIKPDYAPAYLQLGYALLGLGNREDALKALEGYLQVAPNGADAESAKLLVKTLKQ